MTCDTLPLRAMWMLALLQKAQAISVLAQESIKDYL